MSFFRDSPHLKAFRFQAVTLVLLFGLVPARAETTAIIGPLEQQVLEIYRLADDLDPCEKTPTQKSLRLGIARALDLREMEIEEYSRGVARTNRRPTPEGLKAGPLNLIERSESSSPSGDRRKISNGWISYSIGWSDFEKEYQAIRGTRASARWVRLLSHVRATLADDYRRIVRGVWLGLSAEGVNESALLVKLLTACTTEKKCDALKNPDSFKNAIRVSRNVSLEYGRLKIATTDAAREHSAHKLLAALKSFPAYFEPVRQRGPRFNDPHTLIVPLDAGDFRGYETDLAILIEKIWKVGSDRISVEWITSYRTDPIFKFFFTSVPKAASQIDYTRRTITLAQGAIETMPAHLVGRALGFRPRFFSVWRPETCKYEDQSKPDDLMSDGRTGIATGAHWNSLKKAYTEKN